jgi:hypothetical protein
MMVNAAKGKAINIGAMNVKYNFHALDFSLSSRMMIIITTMGKKLHHERISSSFTFGATNRKISFSLSLSFCRAVSGEKRGARELALHKYN